MRQLTAGLAGALFGLGLLVSDMVNPARVLAFLDVAGTWDPTLAFVMGGALIPMAIAWRVAARRGRALSGAAMPGPARGAIDPSLIGGAVLFGIGWGLVGLCPGPALAIIGMTDASGMIFISSMLAGMLGWAFLSAMRARTA
ncbi:YeeE/YedE family protein [Limibaculum sp. M0105]|uniref:YeeE/YedE family protein n=1 Tax=Thermohalobaculum xanthum TaxID=2753746 RepID=A0A8J7SG11_9RHOB|nr:DUF6691 family protein [Thermohalobaculum xanthum]MBK0399882.1 YeeE/YedE family protein [Thermohalobaculum xanthum]